MIENKRLRVETMEITKNDKYLVASRNTLVYCVWKLTN